MQTLSELLRITMKHCVVMWFSRLVRDMKFEGVVVNFHPLVPAHIPWKKLI